MEQNNITFFRQISSCTTNVKVFPRLLRKLSGNLHLISTMCRIRSTCVDFISLFLRMLVCSANYLFPIKFKAKFANELLQKISTTTEGTRVGFKILQKCSELDVHTLRGKEIERKKYGYFTYSYICKIKYVLT